MTNIFAQLPPTCSCRGSGGDDLIALLVVAGILVVAQLAGKTITKWKGKTGMKNVKSIVMVVILAAAVGVVFALKQRQAKPVVEPAATAAVASEQAVALPRMVDLGADKCIPCKMMAPILRDLKKKHAGRFNVEFIDITLVPDAARQYGIIVIPTQIFYDAAGKELFRHEGFMSREDILAKWKELGFDFEKEAGK